MNPVPFGAINAAESIEDEYALSPLQQGMLIQNLRAQSPGVDIEQITIRLPEAVDVAAMKRAWECAIGRHAILRTTFHWESQAQPRQKVHGAARLDWSQQDWSRLSAARRYREFDACLDTERRRGFDPAELPLMRLILIESGSREFELVWTFHHLLLDGRAVVVLLNEVFETYASFCSGSPVALPAAASYRNYIEWLQGLDSGPSEAFWRSNLAGFRQPTPLPHTGWTPKDSDEGAPGERSLTLTRSLTEACTALAAANGVTTNTLMLGVWALLLGRYGEIDDVVFGAIRACRHVPVEGAAGLVGLMINTVPMRVPLPQEATVVPWLQELRKSWMALRPFEHTPLVDIQGWSEMPQGTPLFETLFNFQEPPWDDALRSQGGAWTSREFGIRSQSGYPLVVDAYGGPEIRIKLLYDRNRYEAAGIGRMLGHFRCLLDGMVSNPEGRIWEIPILTCGESRQMLVEWNETRADIGNAATIPALIEERTALAPDALALASEGRCMTYAEFDGSASRIAAQLRSVGVGSGSVVAVFIERGPDMVAAMLGIWKAGAAYLPLDPEYPSERLAFIVRDASAAAVLTSRTHSGRVPPTASAIIELDAVKEGRETNESQPSSRHALPDDLAYVIYTSGSTGEPKGVAVTHRNLSNLVDWHRRTYRIIRTDRASQLASPAFDAAVWELWPYLAAGASVHFPNDEAPLAPARLIQWIDEQAITLCFLPTPMAEAALAESWPDGMALRAVLTGGDKLHRRPWGKFPCMLINHYGPTESTVVATSGVVQRDVSDTQPPPIGRPIANTEVYVLDPRQQPVPVGVTGELYIGGAGVARGYLGRPELTAARFITNPFGATPGSRLYRTGDGVRWRSDGNLEFIGRLDGQVKIRGQRIELGEIEAVLGAHPGLKQCAVVLHEAGEGDKRLVAYFVPSGSAVPSPGELRSFLGKRLTGAMVPGSFVPRDAFPLTPNGKVDRKALSAIEPGVAETPKGPPPRSPVERQLADIWCDLLRLERIGCRDNFFELGGHSLLATQMAARVRSAFEIDLPVRTFFECPTLSALAEAIGGFGRDPDGRRRGIRRRSGNIRAAVAGASAAIPQTLPFAAEVAS